MKKLKLCIQVHTLEKLTKNVYLIIIKFIK